MIKCPFCPRTTLNEESASEAGWILSYWDCKTRTEIVGLFCPSCCRTNLQWNGETGLPELPDDDKPLDKDDARIRVIEYARELTTAFKRAVDADRAQHDARSEWERLKTIADNLATNRDKMMVDLQRACADLSEYTK